MAPPLRSAQYLLGEDVLTTEISSDGTITAQIGNVAVDQATGSNSTVVQQPGFVSRPARADAGTAAAQAWGFRTGSSNVILGMRDTRTGAMYGALDHGETSVYACEGQARVVLKNDGTIAAYTTSDNTATGTAMTATLSPTDGFSVVTEWGGLSIGPTGAQLYTRQGTIAKAVIDISPDGIVKVFGVQISIVGGSVSIGRNASAATPCAYSATGPVNLVSTCVFISP